LPDSHAAVAVRPCGRRRRRSGSRGERGLVSAPRSKISPPEPGKRFGGFFVSHPKLQSGRGLKDKTVPCPILLNLILPCRQPCNGSRARRVVRRGARAVETRSAFGADPACPDGNPDDRRDHAGAPRQDGACVGRARQHGVLLHLVDRLRGPWLQLLRWSPTFSEHTPGNRAGVRNAVRMGFWAMLFLSAPLIVFLLFTQPVLLALGQRPSWQRARADSPACFAGACPSRSAF